MLKQRAVSATLWSAVEQIGARGLSTVFMLIFARYLSAEDFGVFAAATLAITFATTTAQFGLNTVVVQRKELDSHALSTAFWMALAGSFVLAGILVVLAHPIAVLFGNPDIALLIPVLAAGMVISVASAMVTSILRRELNMKALARRSLLANAISGTLATPFVLNGFGAWGLVVQMVGGAMLTLILTLLLIGRPVHWTFDTRVAKDMLRFGLPVLGADLLKEYSNNSPQIFVGILLGPAALGVLVISMKIANLAMSILGSTLINVAFPLLSEVFRQSPERFGVIYLRLVHVASSGIVMLFALAITFREPMVSVILGEVWNEAEPVLLYLFIAGMMMNLNYINSAAFLARGQPRAVFFFSALRAVVGTLLLALSTPFGLVAAAAAYALRSIIIDALQLKYLLADLNLNIASYLRKVGGAMVSGFVLFGSGVIINNILPATSQLGVLVSSVIISLTGYILTLSVIDRQLLIEIRSLFEKKNNQA